PVDIKAEATLSPTICAEALVYEPERIPSAIFLTGVTGFLGAFLLRELLDQTQAYVYCLVRAKDEMESRSRIEKVLKSYSLWEESFGSRIVPVPGDLAKPLLGLSFEAFQDLANRIDVIYHNGALVNFVYPYSVLKATNVLSTEEILKLA